MSIKEKPQEKIEIPLKVYSHIELLGWREKFGKLNMNERGVMFGAYRSRTTDFPPTKYKPESYKSTEYFVVLSRVEEFDNLCDQIEKMIRGDEARDKQYQEIANQSQE